MQITKSTLIAVIGVSKDPVKYGHKIFHDLLKNNYNVIGINPKTKKILDQKIYPSLLSLSQIPDLVITVVPPQITQKIIEECNKLDIKNIWMQPGSESKKAIKLAQNYNLNLTYNVCLMIEQKLW